MLWDKRNFKILNTLKTMKMNWTKQQKEQLVNKVKQNLEKQKKRLMNMQNQF